VKPRRAQTELERRIGLLQYFSDENAKQVFPPAPRQNALRCRQLLNGGYLVVAGLSAMWGYLYAITPAGHAALEQSKEK
jgi:hypothetical protein